MGDTARFWSQAYALLEGRGFVGLQGPTTTLAPGYSVFLSGIFFFWDNPPLAGLITNAVLSLLSVWLIYAALRSRNERYAAWGAFALALHPYLAMYPGQMSSETFGGFLVSLLAFELARYEEVSGTGLGQGNLFAIGVLCLAIALTSPAAGFLSSAIWLVLAIRSRRNVRALGALAMGSLLLYVPWQIHCYRAVGHIEPLLFGRATTISRVGPPSKKNRVDGIILADSGINRWIRTWLERPAQCIVWWDPDVFDTLPDQVFQSRQQRSTLSAFNRRAFQTPTASIWPPTIRRSALLPTNVSAGIRSPTISACPWSVAYRCGSIGRSIFSRGSSPCRG